MLLHLPKRNKKIAARFFSTNPPLFLTPILDLASHFAALLKECQSPYRIRGLHQQILVRGLLYSPSSSSSSLGAVIVSAYLSCNSPDDAASVLERLSPSRVQCWNLIVRQNVQHGRHDRAFNLCYRMRRAEANPDHYTFPFVLKACGELGSYRLGTLVHALVSVSGFDSNVFVCNALIAMYSRCSALEDAYQVFDEITSWGIDDVISWNSIVAAHVKCGSPRLALKLFADMETALSERDNWPRRSDVISLVNVLPACAALRALPEAREIHGYAVRNYLFSDVFVSNAIIDVYSKCGKMEDALKVFRRMENRDLVSWNSIVTGYSQNGEFDEAFVLFKEMRKQKVELNVVTWSAVIAGYAQRGYGLEALDVFRQMQLAGSRPNTVTIISLLSACASVGALSQGMEVHAHALRRCLMNEEDGEEEEDLMVQNALIDMYSKCKNFIAACFLFDSIPLNLRNVVTWTVMIGGYAQHGDANRSLLLFSDMLRDGSSSPNAFTISCALMASARLSALQIGKEIHAYVIRDRYEFEIMFVSNCLIDMYSKCGQIDPSQKVFDKMPQRNYVSWTSLMTGYGMHGYGEDAIRIFNEMQKEGLIPDGVTFLVVLYACSHSGMVELGLKYFDSMSKDYGVVASAEHYACLIDLLGRHGRLHEALEKIEKMPIEPTTAIWVALLGACRIHSNVKLAEYAFEKLTDSGYVNDGTCTLLSNIYANAGCWEKVAKIRHLMKRSGIKKRPGCSWIQGKKGTVTFFVGDRSHPDSQQIYSFLSTLIERIKALGYIPETYFALHDVDDEEKSYLLSEHSEKLALAYGIITSSSGSVIRITKNLRVCGDCHSAMTYISMIVDHEIVLRDSSRFHHFKEGGCSCHGYW